MTTRIYEPCGNCGGTGRVRTYPTSPWGGGTTIYINGDAYAACAACDGSGKGKLKEIHEDSRP